MSAFPEPRQCPYYFGQKKRHGKEVRERTSRNTWFNLYEVMFAEDKILPVLQKKAMRSEHKLDSNCHGKSVHLFVRNHSSQRVLDAITEILLVETIKPRCLQHL